MIKTHISTPSISGSQATTMSPYFSHPHDALTWWEGFFRFCYYIGFCPFKVTCACIQALSFAGIWPALKCFLFYDLSLRRVDEWLYRITGVFVHVSLFRMFWYLRAEIVSVLEYYGRNYPGNTDVTLCSMKLKQRSTKPRIKIVLLYTLFGVFTMSYLVGYAIQAEGDWKKFFRIICLNETILNLTDCQVFDWKTTSETVFNGIVGRLNVAGFLIGDTYLPSVAVFYTCIVTQALHNMELNSKPEKVLESYKAFKGTIKRLNNASGSSLFWVIAGGTPYYISHLPALIRNLGSSNYDLETIRDIFYFSNYFGSMILAAFSLNKIRWKLTTWIGKRETLELFHTPMEYQVLQSEILAGSHLGISPCGMYTLEFGFCKSILGFAATYSILLAQMQVEDRAK